MFLLVIRSSIPEVMSWKSCLGRPTLKSCPGCSAILAIMYWQSCTGSTVLAVCPGIFYLHAIIFLSLFACPLWVILFRLSFLAVMSQAVLSCLTWYKHPVLEVLSWQWCAKSPALSLLSACPVLDVLFWLSCSGWIDLPVWGCLIFAILCWQSCSVSSVLVVLFCLSHSGCPVQAVLF